METKNLVLQERERIAGELQLHGSSPEFSYHIPRNIKEHWDKYGLDLMKKVNRDRVIIVDGTEGVGKSLWTMQQFCYLDPDAFETPEKFVSRVCFTPEEFFNAVRTVKNGVVVFDEAFRGLSSRAALSKVNKKLVSALMEMRQNNNIVFIVLPSFFMLDIYPAMLRSNSLFNIYFSKNSKKRAFRGYNKKDKNAIYQLGVKKGWVYHVNSLFKGYFYNKFPGGTVYEQAYLKKKSEALRDLDVITEKTKVTARQAELQAQRDIMIEMFYKNEGSLVKLSKMLKVNGWDISKSTLGRILQEKNGKTEKSEASEHQITI